MKNNEEIGLDAQQMIVFLTDGDPTAGETNGNKTDFAIRKKQSRRWNSMRTRTSDAN